MFPPPVACAGILGTVPVSEGTCWLRGAVSSPGSAVSDQGLFPGALRDTDVGVVLCAWGGLCAGAELGQREAGRVTQSERQNPLRSLFQREKTTLCCSRIWRFCEAERCLQGREAEPVFTRHRHAKLP